MTDTVTLPSPADYQEAVQNPRICFDDPRLKRSAVEVNGFGLPQARAGGFAVTYRMTENGNAWAVRCFSRHVADREERYAAIARSVKAARLPYFVNTEYYPRGIRVKGQPYPLNVMEWVSGETLESYIYKNFNNSPRMRHLCTEFEGLVDSLAHAGIAHGDLSHLNILVCEHKLKLVDYDGMYVPALRGRNAAEQGLPSFQHLGRRAHHFDETIDRFSTIVIWLALQAIAESPAIWRKHGPGVEGLLFSRQDFIRPHESTVLKAVESISRLKPYAANFRNICLGPIEKVPTLTDFVAGQLVLTAQRSVTQVSVSPVGLYEVVDATDTGALCSKEGQMVTVVGQIADMRQSHTRFGHPYLFLNFGDWRKKCFTLVFWQEALWLFGKVGIEPAKQYLDQWVTVTGVMTLYQGKPQIYIDAPSQIALLSGEAEAKSWLNSQLLRDFQADAPALKHTQPPDATVPTITTVTPDSGKAKLEPEPKKPKKPRQSSPPKVTPPAPPKSDAELLEELFGPTRFPQGQPQSPARSSEPRPATAPVPAPIPLSQQPPKPAGVTSSAPSTPVPSSIPQRPAPPSTPRQALPPASQTVPTSRPSTPLVTPPVVPANLGHGSPQSSPSAPLPQAERTRSGSRKPILGFALFFIAAAIALWYLAWTSGGLPPATNPTPTAQTQEAEPPGATSRSMLFCTSAGFDYNLKRCVSPRNRFIGGQGRLYLSWTPPDEYRSAVFRRMWYREGIHFATGEDNNAYSHVDMVGKRTWAPGRYKVEWYVNDVLIQEGEFIVE